MPHLSLRFHKYDKFKNPVFIASDRVASEKASFQTLRKYYEAIRDREYDTFNPVYHDDKNEFTTIRFKYRGDPLEVSSTYKVDFKITKKEKLARIYVDCYINKIRFGSKPAPIDEGEEIDLD